jgi:Tfp pilus assembly protein PilF
LISFLAFGSVFHNQFVNWDDYETLVNNSHYRGWGWPQLRWMWTTFYMGHYQPLSWLTFTLDFSIWGLSPAAYHLTNLLLHTVNAVVFFFVARFLLACAFRLPHAQGNSALDFSAALAALIFAIHPLRVESVAWATERRDVLSGVFFLVAVYGYLRYQNSSARARGGQWLLLSFSAYFLSLAAKATAITLPVVLLLIDIYPLRRWSERGGSDRKKILWEKAPFLIFAVVFAALALLAQQSAGALRPVKQYFFSYRIGQVAYGVVFYLWKSILPLGLSPLYELPYDFAEWTAVFVLSALLAAAITVGLFLARRRWPAGLACWIYYIVLLAPVLGVAQSGPQLVADRYSYLACMSWAVLIGGGVFKLWQSVGSSDHRRAIAITGFAAASCTSLALGVLTFRQTEVWRDTRTLWRHVIAVAPPSSIAHYNLGRELEDQGKFADALDYYNQAVAINPANPDAQYNLARLLARQGKQTEAIEHYRLALAIRPKDADTHNNLGLLLALRGDLDGSLAEFRQAVAIDPAYAKGYFNIGRVLARQGRLEAAEENYRQALKFSPNETEILSGLSELLMQQKRWDEAVVYLRQAVALKPRSADEHIALARALVAQGNKVEAEQRYQEALRLLKTPGAPPDKQPGR